MSELINSEALTNWFWSIIVVVAVFAFWFGINKAYRRWDKTGKDDERKAQHRRVAKYIHSFVKYALIAVTVLVILQIHGVEVGPMAASLGIVGIVLGFALQTGLEDVIMGVHIVTDGFFHVGDVLIYRGVQGEVISVTPQTTKIRNIVDRSVIAISNRNLHEAEVASHISVIRVPISYRTDPVQAEGILKECCMRAPQLMEVIDSCRYSFIDEFEKSSAVHVLVIESNPINRIASQRALRSLLLRDLQKKASLSLTILPSISRSSMG